MEALDIFTVRDFCRRAGKLLRHSEHGRLALITKHGRPAILGVPFDERLPRLAARVGKIADAIGAALPAPESAGPK